MSHSQPKVNHDIQNLHDKHQQFIIYIQSK